MDIKALKLFQIDWLRAEATKRGVAQVELLSREQLILAIATKIQAQGSASTSRKAVSKLGSFGRSILQQGASRGASLSARALSETEKTLSRVAAEWLLPKLTAFAMDVRGKGLDALRDIEATRHAEEMPSAESFQEIASSPEIKGSASSVSIAPATFVADYVDQERASQRPPSIESKKANAELIGSKTIAGDLRAETPAAEKPVSEEPGAEKPAAEKPAAKELVEPIVSKTMAQLLAGQGHFERAAKIYRSLAERASEDERASFFELAEEAEIAKHESRVAWLARAQLAQSKFEDLEIVLVESALGAIFRVPKNVDLQRNDSDLVLRATQIWIDENGLPQRSEKEILIAREGHALLFLAKPDATCVVALGEKSEGHFASLLHRSTNVALLREKQEEKERLLYQETTEEEKKS